MKYVNRVSDLSPKYEDSSAQHRRFAVFEVLDVRLPVHQSAVSLKYSAAGAAWVKPLTKVMSKGAVTMQLIC